MPCIAPDGSLSNTAKNLLTLLKKPMPIEDISRDFKRPTYILRSMLRELKEADLVKEDGEFFQITGKGTIQIKDF